MRRGVPRRARRLSRPGPSLETTFQGAPALRLALGGVVAIVLPGLGGRVVALPIDGHDVLWQDEEARTTPFWRRGGWKTWIAPQASWPAGEPPRHLDAGAYAVEVIDPVVERGGLASPTLRLTSPTCGETGLEIVREVRLTPPEKPVSDTFAILQVGVTLTNRGGVGPVEAGIWEVIQLRKPVRILFPIDPTAFAGEGGVRTYRSERDSVTARPRHLRIVREGEGERARSRAEIACTGGLRFKYGARTPSGLGKARAIMAERGRQLRLTFAAPAGAAYAHEGANIEVFSSDEALYCELEAHAPLAVLAPGASVSHAFALEASRTSPGKRNERR